MFKTCARCKQLLPVVCFQHDNRVKDGYKNPCKLCLGLDMNIAIRRAERQQLKSNGKNRCAKCNNIKQLNEFSSLRNVCIDCLKIVNANRDRTKEYAKETEKRKRKKSRVLSNDLYADAGEVQEKATLL